MTILGIIAAASIGGAPPAPSSYDTYVASLAPELWLKLDETSGTTAADASGHGHTGTLAGGATFADAGIAPLSGMLGFGRGIDFAVTNAARITTPIDAAAWGSGFSSGSSWTLVLALQAGAGIEQYILDRQNNMAVIYNFVADTLEFFALSYSGDDPRASSQIPLAASDIDTVHQVVYRYDAGQWSGWLDGEQIFSVAASFNLATGTQYWNLGAADASNESSCKVRDAQVYKRALSDAEIAELWSWRNNGVPLGDAAFARVVSLLHCDGVDGSTTFPDITGKIWSVSGNTQISDAEPSLGLAIAFDGAGDWIESGAFADFDLFAGDCTIELTALWSDSTPSQALWQIQSGSADRVAVGLLSGQIYLYTETAGGGGAIRVTGTAPANGAPHQVVVDKRSGTWRLIVDGATVGTSTTTVYPTGDLKAYIGKQGSSGTNYFTGYIKEWRVTRGVSRYGGDYSPDPNQFPDFGLPASKLLSCLLRGDAVQIHDTHRQAQRYISSGATYESVLADFELAGNVYWEATITWTGSGSRNGIGVAVASFPTSSGSTWLGSTSDGCAIWGPSNGVYRSGSRFFEGGDSPTGSPVTYMFAFKATTRQLWIGVAGIGWFTGDPAAGTSPMDTLPAGLYRPALTFDIGANESIAMNFGQAAFVDAIPVGFNAPIAAWNPSDANPGVLLSDESRVVTKTSGSGNNYAAVRASRGLSSGKWYWEVEIIAGNTSPFITVGVANASASLADYIGADANGWCYYQETGNKIHSASSVAYGAAYGNDAVIGIKLDMDAGTVEFFKDNVSQGEAFTGLSGTVYPTVAIWRQDAPTHQVRGRFAREDLIYDPSVEYSVLG